VISEEVFTEDGWFKTGDIGIWNDNGSLSVVDRKKNLVKGPGGEYIALEKLESIFKNSSFVANACVYACSDVPKIIAIVQPRNDKLNNVEQPESEVLRDLQELGSKNGLKRFELATHVILAQEEWDPDNNMLTAAMKLNRKAIYDRYQDDIHKIVRH